MRPRHSTLAHQFLWIACAILVSAETRSQSDPYLVGWGPSYFDSRASGSVFTQIAATLDMAVMLRVDGTAFAGGYLAPPPPTLPAGTQYVHCSAGPNGLFVGVRSDGLIEQWDGYPQTIYPAPFLPPGVSYTKAAVSSWTAAAVRSDGQIVVWGRDAYLSAYNPPPPPIGSGFVKVVAMQAFFAALSANGRVHTWGLGTLPVPTLPPGTVFLDIAAGERHLLMLRSDGAIDAVGYSVANGQTTVPTLPPGTTYTAIGAGTYTSYARRSDGTWIGWGLNSRGQVSIPQPPPGLTYQQVVGGYEFGMALRSDGTVIDWGTGSGFAVPFPVQPLGVRVLSVSADAGHATALTDAGAVVTFGSSNLGLDNVPPLPPGMRYTATVAGYAHNVALRSDGALSAWGDNSGGQLQVPLLPTGMRYTKVDATYRHSIALRSDGMAVQIGNSGSPASPPPAPPTGTRYVEVVATTLGNLCTRSDGALIASGVNTNGRFTIPPAPPGTTFRKGVAGSGHAVGLLTDGNILQWGGSIGLPGPTAPPPLPAGVVYVDISSGDNFMLARRSDGAVVHWGNDQWFQDRIPPIPLGMSCLGIDAGVGNGSQSSAIYGPRSTYVTFANGCAGTLPPARLIPQDTPRIGDTLVVRMFDLPAHAALLAFGWNRVTQPVALTQYGLTGCALHINIDSAWFLAGADHTVRFELPIPYFTGLVGLEFYHQALVLDPTANPAGAVVSDAAHAYVGG